MANDADSAKYEAMYEALHAAMERTRDLAGASAEQVYARLFPDEFVGSVIDFGCGRGAWLEAAQKRGAQRILGLESFVEGETAAFVRQHDLSTPYTVDAAFDLAVSVEVGEHLAAEHADTLVQSLAAAAPWCLFSAATPLQGGLHHVNEQPPVYWVQKFAAAGLQCLDIRPLIWDDNRIEPWYRQNLLLFRRPQSGLSYLDEYLTDKPAHLIHPEIFAAYGGSRGAEIIWDHVDGQWVANAFHKDTSSD